MSKWEYQKLELEKELSEEELNNRGKEEWELIHHQGFYKKRYSTGSLTFKYLFKRAVKRRKATGSS